MGLNQSDSIFFLTVTGSYNTGIKLLVPDILLTGGLVWEYADLSCSSVSRGTAFCLGVNLE